MNNVSPNVRSTQTVPMVTFVSTTNVHLLPPSVRPTRTARIPPNQSAKTALVSHVPPAKQTQNVRTQPNLSVSMVSVVPKQAVNQTQTVQTIQVDSAVLSRQDNVMRALQTLTVKHGNNVTQPLSPVRLVPANVVWTKTAPKLSPTVRATSVSPVVQTRTAVNSTHVKAETVCMSDVVKTLNVHHRFVTSNPHNVSTV